MAFGFTAFVEGENHILASGIPNPVYFLLSTKPAYSLSNNATLAGASLGEITGTGYTRQQQSEPTPANAADLFGTVTWNTGTATDWPASVYSVIAATSTNNSGVALCAWDLQQSLDPPVISSINAQTSGGTFTAGTYYYAITAVNAFGETTPSNEYSFTVSNNYTLTLHWTAITGATGYRVYRSTSPGAWSQGLVNQGGFGGIFTALAAIVASGTTTSWTDTGVATTTGAAPVVNTSVPSRAMNRAGIIEQVTPTLFLSSSCPGGARSGGGGGGGGQNLGPTVTSISPSSVPLAGGSVTILGTNFTSTANVSVGSTTVTNITFNSATSLTIVAPALTAGSYHVVVGTVNGSSTQSNADLLTYTGGGGGGTGAYDQAILNDGPILYLPGKDLNNLGSGTYTVSNHGATVNSTSPVLPNSDPSFYFPNSGVNQNSTSGAYISVTDPADGSLSINKTGSMSMEFWLSVPTWAQPGQLTNSLGGGLNVIGKSFDASGSSPQGCEYEFRLYSDTGTDNPPYSTSFYAFNTSCGYGAGYNDNVGTKAVNSWWYWCGTFTGSGVSGSVKIYGGLFGSSQYRGQLLNQTSMNDSVQGNAISPGHTTTPFTIGACGVGSGAGNVSWLYGSIGKVALYNKVLSAGQISNHFQAMAGGSGGSTVPTVTGISPSTGTSAGGTSITITGTNFGGTQNVAFSGLSASGFIVNSPTQITATSPPHSAGVVHVQVITTGGTSATSSADQFTYTSGGGTSYDAAVHTDTPILYITNTLANQGSGSYTINNMGGAAASASMPNGDAAWHFNGSSQYIRVVNSSDLSIDNTGALSLELWFRMSVLSQPNEVDTGYTNMIGKSIENSTPDIASDGCEYEFRYYSANTIEDPAANAPTDCAFYAFNQTCGSGAGHNDHVAKSINVWYYACGTYDTGANAINVYVGPRGGSITHSTPDTFSGKGITPSNTTTPFTIGACGIGGGTDSYWFGDIGKVAVYDYALTSTRINAHFAAM